MDDEYNQIIIEMAVERELNWAVLTGRFYEEKYELELFCFMPSLYYV